MKTTIAAMALLSGVLAWHLWRAIADWIEDER